MRRLLALALPLAVFLLQAPDAGAQEPDGVWVTVTLDSAVNVTAVEFPDLAPGVIFERPERGEVQYRVGLLLPGKDGYRTEVVYTRGNHGKQRDTIIFAAEATCAETGVTEGSIQRIACAVIKGGEALACSAVYDMMMQEPPPTCTGTYSCIKCGGGVKVCGSNPECVD